MGKEFRRPALRQAAPDSCTRVLERTAEHSCGGTLTNTADEPALHLVRRRRTNDTCCAAARPSAALRSRATASAAAH